MNPRTSGSGALIRPAVPAMPAALSAGFDSTVIEGGGPVVLGGRSHVRAVSRGAGYVGAVLGRVVSLVLVMGALSGCVLVDVKVPLDTDLDHTKLGAKSGSSTFHSVLWAVAWGDAGTQAAAIDGGLEVIQHADQEIFMVLGGIYYRRTTVVYGD
ncbi:MAG: TRL domain-containing protein [Planctomycetota bacterium]